MGDRVVDRLEALAADVAALAVVIDRALEDVGAPDAARKNPHAVALGRMGGASRSPAKVAAVRLNGRLGGRPRKSAR